MTMEIAKGNLLEQRVDAIVNTVNTVGVMGKGIALQFKRKWPANFKAYEIACKRGEVVPCKMFIFDNGQLAEPKFIINFPTKRHWRQPSRLSDIECGLEDLIKQIKALRIRSIALPPLGCGNGGLEWTQVRPLIEKAFSAVPEVEARLFTPSDAGGVRELTPEAIRPVMTAGRAAIVKILSIYRQMLYPLSQIEIQKLAYFLTEAGQDMGALQFRRHNYGPYAPALRHVLIKMDGAYLQGVGDGTRPSEISIKGDALKEADAFLNERKDAATSDRVNRIASLIEGFETPYGMELLATVHWAAQESRDPRDIEEVTKRVHDWNDRKREIMKPSHVRVAHDRLLHQGWL